MKNDRKDSEQKSETSTFLDRLEQATPAQASQAIITQIMLKLKKKLTS